MFAKKKLDFCAKRISKRQIDFQMMIRFMSIHAPVEQVRFQDDHIWRTVSSGQDPF